MALLAGLKLRKRALIAALLLGALLGATEVALRMSGFGTGTLFYFDRDIGFRMVAHQSRWMLGRDGNPTVAVTSNHLGFRGPAPTSWRPDGAPLVVALGDSFTYGINAEEGETWPQALQDTLKSQWNGTEVLNASFPGWNPDAAARAYRFLIRDLDPTIVVLGVTQDDLRPAVSGVRYSDSWVLSLLGSSAIREAITRNLLPKLPGYRLPEPEGHAERIRYWRDHSKSSWAHPEDPRWRQNREEVLGAIVDLASQTRMDDVHLLVVNFPNDAQVLALREAAERGQDTEEVKSALCGIARWLDAELNARLIPYSDLTDALVETPLHAFGPYDASHPSPEGYRALAVAVEAALRTHGLLPEGP